MNGMQGNRYLLLGLLVLVLAGGLLYTMLGTSKTENPAEMATTTDMTSTSTATGPSNPVVKPVGSTQTTANNLVKIEYRGGVCPSGKTCYSYKVITKDAQYYKNGVKVLAVNKTDVAKLSLEIDKANWGAIRAKPHLGENCVTTVREEVTYTFYTKHGEEKLSNCVTEIDFTMPLFKLIPTILPTNQ